MTREWIAAAAGATAAATWLLPLPGALPAEGRTSTIAFATVTAAALVALCAVLLRAGRPSAQRQVALLMIGGGLVLGAAAFLAGSRVQQTCTALHGGRPVLIGTQLTTVGQDYRADNPGLPVGALLEDAAGEAELVWTRASIAQCRLLLSGTYFLWVPMLAVAILGAGASLTRGRLTVSRVAAAHDAVRARDDASAEAEADTRGRTRYDVFISYRHGDRDAQVAHELLDALEAEGYAVAFDARDFPANESFLAEMERCIRQSRFTLALVSRRYLQSGNCEEEAMICKVLDMSERRRRLIPLYLEPAEVPIWLHGIVGIRLDEPSTRIDPMDRLVATLGPPSPKARPGRPGRTGGGDR